MTGKKKKQKIWKLLYVDKILTKLKFNTNQFIELKLRYFRPLYIVHILQTLKDAVKEIPAFESALSCLLQERLSSFSLPLSSFSSTPVSILFTIVSKPTGLETKPVLHVWFVLYQQSESGNRIVFQLKYQGLMMEPSRSLTPGPLARPAGGTWTRTSLCAGLGSLSLPSIFWQIKWLSTRIWSHWSDFMALQMLLWLTTNSTLGLVIIFGWTKWA